MRKSTCNNCGLGERVSNGLCSGCFGEYQAEYRTRTKETRRWRKIAQNYGLTKNDYESMLDQQNGCCAICGNEEEHVTKGVLSVDHCHQTNEVRGLLCHRCNLGLGNFREDIELLQSAIKYLTMRKYADTSKVEVVDPREAQRIESNLHNIGKTSAAHLSDDERKKVMNTSK